jgi:hypothetical protein
VLLLNIRNSSSLKIVAPLLEKLKGALAKLPIENFRDQSEKRGSVKE